MNTSHPRLGVLVPASGSEWVEKAARETECGAAPARGKRLFDIALAVGGLVLLLPIVAVAGVAVKLESRGPVLYVSRRLGRHGRVFRCLKFRVLRADGEMTRVGDILRRFGIDELPQLVNVLCGEMSVVGPRPVMAGSSEGLAMRRYRRFEVKPGITGLWPLHEADWAQRRPYVSPDETYRRNWSVWLDLLVVVRSFSAALAGRGR